MLVGCERERDDDGIGAGAASVPLPRLSSCSRVSVNNNSRIAAIGDATQHFAGDIIFVDE